MKNLQELKPVGKLSPFAHFCCTIGNLPTSYMISLTYEEQLLWLCNYLEKTVIAAVNTNAEAVAELQELYNQLKEYVNNYFTNLDVQEEINKKLDEMAESGQLTEIVTAYLQIAGILAFNTVADMKNSDNLIDGSFAETFGYAQINDKKGAKYKIRTITNTDVVDNINIIALKNTNLIAELMNENKKVIIFDTVTNMKNSSGLVAGDFVKTSDFKTQNDNGGASYFVKLKENEIVDEMTIIELQNNLIAILQYEKTINLKSLGAEANEDITPHLQKAINILNGGTIVIPAGIYKITSTINFPNSQNLLLIKGENNLTELDCYIETENAYAFNCGAEDGNYKKISFENLIIANKTENINVNGIYLRRNTETKIFENVTVRGFYDNVIIDNNWSIVINKLRCLNAKHNGLAPLNSNSVLNNIQINNSIFQHNLNYNLSVHGKNIVIIGCDFSNYDGAYGLYAFGCSGLCLIGNFYEESTETQNGNVIRLCNGVVIQGNYFEIKSTQENYLLIDINNSTGVDISANNFNGISTNKIIKTHDGSKVSINDNFVNKASEFIYVHNTYLEAINNQVGSDVVTYIHQENHLYAFIKLYGHSNLLNKCIIPHPEICIFEFINLLKFATTTNLLNGIYVGQQCFDTTTNTLKIWNGSSWV